jgi:ClpX C4-type zinc finger protein
MICYEVWVNGKRLCTAGAEKMRSIYASLIFPKQINRALFMVGVDTEPTKSLRENVFWVDRGLKLNDEIKIKIVERHTADKPKSVKSFGTKITASGKKKLSCSFCGKGEKQVPRLITGSGANVCSECVQLAVDILNDEGITRRSTGRGKQRRAR